MAYTSEMRKKDAKKASKGKTAESKPDIQALAELAGLEGVDKWGRTPNQVQEIDSLKFMFNDLLSQENLMNNEQVAKLQLELNKWVFGKNELKVDGNLGRKTVEAINVYKSASRYWHPHHTSWVNPHAAHKRWMESSK